MAGVLIKEDIRTYRETPGKHVHRGRAVHLRSEKMTIHKQ